MRLHCLASRVMKPIALITLIVWSGPIAIDGLRQQATKGNPKTSVAQLTVCREVDDNWNPLGAAETWPANKSFNVLLISPTPFKADFIGFVIHKQGPDGKDVEFVNEWQQTIENAEKARKYCTTEGLTSLPRGRYSIYAIDWRKREPSEHRGNLSEYFAKITLTVK